MKAILTLGLLVLAIGAQAQQSTTNTKKAKAKAKATAANTAPAQTTIATTAITPTGTLPAGTAPAAAAGTSTATLPEAAPAKKWSAGITLNPSASTTDVEDIQVLSTVKAGYKITNKITAKVGQTFETLSSNSTVDADRDALTEANNFRAAYTDVSLSTSLKGILGSNDMPVSLVYRNVAGDAHISTLGTYSAIHGLTDLNLGVPYTINPSFDAGVDFQIRNTTAKAGPQANGHRIIVAPNVSYNMNDKVSFYQVVGYMLSLRDNTEYRRRYERLYLETGVNYAPTKAISLTLNVNQDKAVYVRQGEADSVSNFALYNPTEPKEGGTFDAVGYEAIATVSF